MSDEPIIDLSSDNYFMGEALRQAMKAWDAEEVPIGAVIVHEGRILSRAFNQVEMLNDATAHAEMLALTAAEEAFGNWRLTGCTLYVTKEPCPMCSGAVIMSRVGEVHFGFKDPKMGCLGGAQSLHELPQSNHTPSVDHGTFGQECHALVQAFFKFQRDQKDSL